MKNKRTHTKAKSIKDKKERDKSSKIIQTKEIDKKINYAVVQSFRSDMFSENFDNSGSAMTLINHCSNNNSKDKIEEIKSSQTELNEDSLFTSKELDKSQDKMINNSFLSHSNEKKLKSILKKKKLQK